MTQESGDLQAGRLALEVHVRARPIEGGANEALLKAQTKALVVPKSAVAVHCGGQFWSRILMISGLSGHEAKSCLTGL